MPAPERHSLYCPEWEALRDWCQRQPQGPAGAPTPNGVIRYLVQQFLAQEAGKRPKRAA